MRTVLALIMVVVATVSGQTILPQPEPHSSVGSIKPELTLSGRVLLPNGHVPPEPVQVECSGAGASFVLWTDARGGFSIPLEKFEVPHTSDGMPDFSRTRLTFRLPGVAEQSVALNTIRTARDLNLPDIRLVTVAPQAAGAMLSDTSLQVPSAARKAYLRALREMGENNLTQAIASFDRAVALYPGYAAAYLWKGRTLEKLGNRDAAREAYRFAAGADPAYAQPLIELASMASQDQNSAEAAGWAERLNRQSPGTYPQMYLVAAISNYNLEHFDVAAKAAREGIAADRAHAYPGLHRSLGQSLYATRDYAGARTELAEYLAAVQNAEDAAEIRALIADCDRHR